MLQYRLVSNTKIIIALNDVQQVERDIQLYTVPTLNADFLHMYIMFAVVRKEDYNSNIRVSS